MCSKKSFLFLILFAILLTGCGGPTHNPDSPGRGEGDIPLGRVRGGGRIKVIVQESNGTVDIASMDTSNVFYSDRLAYGTTTFVISSDDPNYESRTYTLQAGHTQRYIINAALPPRGRRADVSGLQILPIGMDTIPVGTEIRIRFVIQGTNSQGLSPTVWVDGGVGSLNSANVFTAVSSGTGMIRAELMGYTAEIPIRVVE